MTLKTIKVNPIAHSRLMTLARKRCVSAGTLLLQLLDGVNVPLEPVQRERWEAAAKAQGVSLPQFILLRVESQLSAVPAVRGPQGEPLPVTSLWGACCTPKVDETE